MNEPQQLGRYQLVRVLGRGAMGLVYEARDPKLNRQVAIKVISTQRAGDAAMQAEYSARFVHEAQAVARMNHPHIVTVYDFGEENGVAYLVMELVAGEELGGYFGEGQSFQLEFTLEDAIRMSCELLDAAGYAHERGIVHRDIKPANVMLSADLRVKLTDFGVASMADVGAGDSESGAVAGTPSYMSPEQIGGQVVGPRSDIFAVGIILYQFLTGERPFRGKGLFAVQQKILYEQPMPPSLLNPALDPVFDRIVARALAKRPEDRYPSARHFREDLAKAMRGEALPEYEAPAPVAPPAMPLARPAAMADTEADTTKIYASLPGAFASASYEDPDATMIDIPPPQRRNGKQP
jgi:serine/threonine protein kinase